MGMAIVMLGLALGIGLHEAYEYYGRWQDRKNRAKWYPKETIVDKTISVDIGNLSITQAQVYLDDLKTKRPKI